MQIRFTYIFLILMSAVSVFSVTISGKIYNASQDSATVANHAISLQKMATGDRMPVQLMESATSSNGVFTFQMADMDSATTYFTSTDYMGVRYYSDAVAFTGTSGTVSMVVHDSTHSTRHIQTLMHHLMIEDRGDAVAVRETRVLENSGQETILEVMQSEQGAFLSKTRLPAGASGFQPLSEQLQNELVFENGEVYDIGIMPLGNRQIGYVYNLPWKKNSVGFEITLTFPTRNFDIFISDPNIQLISQDIQDRGPFTIRGTSYQRFGINDAPAGTIVRFALQRSKKPEPLQSPLFALVLTSLLLGAALIFGHFFQAGIRKK